VIFGKNKHNFPPKQHFFTIFCEFENIPAQGGGQFVAGRLAANSLKVSQFSPLTSSILSTLNCQKL